ncbi:unnamed protein product [Arctogadus glacialis]
MDRVMVFVSQEEPQHGQYNPNEDVGSVVRAAKPNSSAGERAPPIPFGPCPQAPSAAMKSCQSNDGPCNRGPRPFFVHTFISMATLRGTSPSHRG